MPLRLGAVTLRALPLPSRSAVLSFLSRLLAPQLLHLLAVPARPLASLGDIHRRLTTT